MRFFREFMAVESPKVRIAREESDRELELARKRKEQEDRDLDESLAMTSGIFRMERGERGSR